MTVYICDKNNPDVKEKIVQHPGCRQQHRLGAWTVEQSGDLVMIVFVSMSQRLCVSPTAQVAAYTIYGTWPSDTPVLQYVVQRFDSNGSGAKNKKLGVGHELSNFKKKVGREASGFYRGLLIMKKGQQFIFLIV